MSHLEVLPEELLASIALLSDASSVISLSQTSRRLRASCFTALVLKTLLIDSQKYHWDNPSLDIVAVEVTAEKNVQAWARFALADHTAWELAQKECPLESTERFLEWLPELFVLRHPFMLHQCWSRFLREPMKQPAKQVFCLAVAILAVDRDMPQVTKSLNMNHDPKETNRYDTKAYLWSLCSIALIIRTAVRLRLAAWPFNGDAHVPYVMPPGINQTPLTPLDSSYSIPRPFGRGREWQHWYSSHSLAMLCARPSTLFSGTWCGYYTYFGQPQRLDPPMVDISFSCTECNGRCERKGQVGHRNNGSDRLWSKVAAEACRDGLDTFRLSGTVMQNGDGDVEIELTKDYSHGGQWDWDCVSTQMCQMLKETLC